MSCKTACSFSSDASLFVHLSFHGSVSLCFYLEFAQKYPLPTKKTKQIKKPNTCLMFSLHAPAPCLTPLSETVSKTSCVFSQGAYDAQDKVCVREWNWMQQVILFFSIYWIRSATIRDDLRVISFQQIKKWIDPKIGSLRFKISATCNAISRKTKPEIIFISAC